MHLYDIRHHPILKFFAYAAFALIIISFVFFYGWSSAETGRQDGAVAYARYRSDDSLSFLPWRKWKEISVDEVNRSRDAVFNRKLGMLSPQIAQMVAQGQINMDRRALATNEEAVQDIMDMHILQREAKRLGLVVTRQEAINFIRTRFQNNKAAYDAFLERSGLTENGFIQMMMDDQAALRARSFVANEARVSLYDLWLNYVLTNEKLRLQIASYPAKDFGDKLALTDADLDAFLKERHEKYRIPDQRRYQYVKKTLADVRKSVEPTPEQLAAYYETNKTSFNRTEAVKLEDLFAPESSNGGTTATLALMTKLQADLTTTTAWRELAPVLQKKNPGSAIYYRDLGWVEKSDEAKANFGEGFLDRAFALASNDRVSSPTLGARGVHIMRRVDRRSAGLAPMEQVKDEILTKYKDEESSRLFKDEIKRMDEEVKKHKTLREFAAAVQMEDAITTSVAATDFLIPEIGSVQEHGNYVHGLRLNELSEILPVPAEDPTFYCALQIVEEKPTHLPELSEVRDKVEQDCRLAKGREAAKAAAQAAYDKLVPIAAELDQAREAYAKLAKENSDPAAIGAAKAKVDEAMAKIDLAVLAADAPKKPVETAPFKRSEPIKELNSPLIGFDKQAIRLNAGSIGFSPFGATAESAEGYAVWRTLGIETPTRKDFERDRRTFEREYWAVMHETVVNEWLADKRKELGYELVMDQQAQ